MRGRPFRGVRGRLLLVVLAALAVALATSTAGFNVLFTRASEQEADSFLRQRADSERGLVRIVGGRVHVADSGDDPLGDSRVWIFQGGRLVEGPRLAGQTGAAVRSLADGPARFVDVAASDLRLYAVPVLSGGRRLGTVVAATSLAPYEQTRRTALIASSLFALTLLVLVGAIVWWLLRAALRPVAEMTAQAEAWSELELEGRFHAGEPHDELTQLAATLDGLLDRIAASLRHERLFTAELSHELRTPLAKVLGETELALRRERTPEEYRASLDLVRGHGQQLARILETLLLAARQDAAGPRGTADAYAVLNDVVGGVVGDGRIDVSAPRPARPLRLGLDADLAACILKPVVENACRYGRSRVAIDVAQEGSAIVYRVIDDGPGVELDEEDAIFEPGRRGRAGEGTAGAGLGLALARRLARSAAGDVSARPGGEGSFTVSLPAG
jgi:signal transduction histidine kinase